jgi:Predicted nuclease of the RecB family
MAIIVSRNHKNATKLEEQSFGLEDHLQAYIADVPESVPIYEIEEDARLFIAAREFSTNSGPIDALGFDQYGNIYVIETKLYKNAGKRMVVAQALDYGASLWRHKVDFDEFISQLNSHTEKIFDISFKDKFEDFFQIDSLSAFENMQKNLSSGVIKFVVLMDKLHDRLKDLIVYVNQNSKFDLYAVELEFYKHNEFEIIIPKLFGSEVKKDVATKSTGGSYKYIPVTAEEFESTINGNANLSDDGRQAILELRNIYQKSADKLGGTTGYYKSENANRLLFTVYSGVNNQIMSPFSNGEVWFRNNKTGPIAEYCERVLHQLIEEQIVDKTEKNLTASQWSIRNLYFTNSKNDPSIVDQLKRFIEICEEELQ